MRKQGSGLPLVLEPAGTLSSHSRSSTEIPISSSSLRSFPYSSSQHERVKACDRLKEISTRNKQSIKNESAVATALANRAYHLPNNGYCADLSQYVVNNHLLFGLCCRHPKHPIGKKLRAINLLGSALCGLAITNLIWIGTIYFNEDPDAVLFKISFQGSTEEDDMLFENSTNATIVSPSFELLLPGPRNDATSETLENTLQVTKGMVLLWTVGGCLHAMYDNAVWYASACACCLPGNRCENLGFMRRVGGYCIFFVVMLVAATASFAIVLRITLMSDEDVDTSILQSAGLVDDAIDVGSGFDGNVGKYEFILSYFVEFLLALFVYYPLFQIVLFSGVLNRLGCGKIRFLGGRPFEMRQLE